MCGRGENGFAVQKLEVVTTFSMQGCEALTEKFDSSFKGTAEMAKGWQAASMVAEVEARTLSAFHGTTSALERQVEAMEDKSMLLHLVFRQCNAEFAIGKRFQCLLQFRGHASGRCEPGFCDDENLSREYIH